MKVMAFFFIVLILGGCSFDKESKRKPSSIITNITPCSKILSKILKRNSPIDGIEKLERVGIKSLLEDEMIGENIIIHSNNGIYEGEVAIEKYGSDYQVIKLVSGRAVSFIDPELAKDFKVYKKGKLKKRFGKKPTPIILIDQKRFLKGICEGVQKIKLSSFSKDTRQIFKLQKRKFSEKIIFSRISSCVAQVPIFTSAFVLYLLIEEQRDDRNRAIYLKNHNEKLGLRPEDEDYRPYELMTPNMMLEYIEKHNSNFLLGLAFMSAFHHCSNALTPFDYKTLLYTSVGLQLAANSYFELSIFDGQKDPLNNNKAIKTDYNDFATGTVGALTYYYIGRLIQNYFDNDIVRFCSKYE